MKEVGNEKTEVPLMDMSGRHGQPMGDLVTHWADVKPDQPALTQDGVTISWKALNEQAIERARRLLDLGVEPNDFVVLSLPNSIAFYETTLALWKIGATPAPVSYQLPGRELATVIDLIMPKLVIGPPPSEVPGHKSVGVELTGRPGRSSPPPAGRIAKYWKAVTSGGSTGRPKVIVDHMESVWDPESSSLGRQPEDVVLNPGPLYHNGPFVIMHTSLLCGCHVVNMSRFNAREWLRLSQEYHVQWGYLVPTMMHRIWREKDRAAFELSMLRMIVHMAAPCPSWLKAAWIEWLGAERVWETYAGTESVGGCINSGRQWLEHPGTVGLPMGGSRLVIRDDKGNTLPPNEIGEIYFEPSPIAGAGFHYLGGEPRVDGELKGYGDMGWVDEDGYLYIADRRTDMVVSGGANIYPAEIEAAIEENPLVRSCVAVGVPDDDLGAKLHAVVDIPTATPTLSLEELYEFLAERLARYKIPRGFTFVSEPLRDDAGKVRRSLWREKLIRGETVGSRAEDLR